MRVTLLIAWYTHFEVDAFATALKESAFAARVGAGNIYIPKRLTEVEGIEVDIGQIIISQILEGRPLWNRPDETREVEVCVRLFSLTHMCNPVHSCLSIYTATESARNRI